MTGCREVPFVMYSNVLEFEDLLVLLLCAFIIKSFRKNEFFVFVLIFWDPCFKYDRALGGNR